MSQISQHNDNPQGTKNLILYGVIAIIFFIALFNVYSFFEKRRQAILDKEAQRTAQLEKLKLETAQKEREAQLEHEIKLQNLALEKDRQEAELLSRKLKQQKQLERYKQIKQAREISRDHKRLEKRIQQARTHSHIPEGLSRKTIDGIRSATYLTIRHNSSDYIGQYQPQSILKAHKLTSAGANGLMLFAMISSDTKAIQEVIAIGHDINETNKAGYSPLMFASAYNRAEVINMLIEHGADIDAKEYLTQGNALHIAARLNPNPESVESLVQNGIDINARDKDGNTALLLAAQANPNLEVVEKLIELGADITDLNKLGKDAYSYAYERINKRTPIGRYAFISDEYQEKILKRLAQK